MISAPLRDRFGVVERLEYYNENELADIIRRTADIFVTELEEGAAEELARRARGTPRIANRLLKRVRDFAQVDGEGIITYDLATGALERLQVDKLVSITLMINCSEV